MDVHFQEVKKPVCMHFDSQKITNQSSASQISRGLTCPSPNFGWIQRSIEQLVISRDSWSCQSGTEVPTEQKRIEASAADFEWFWYILPRSTKGFQIPPLCQFFLVQAKGGIVDLQGVWRDRASKHFKACGIISRRLIDISAWETRAWHAQYTSESSRCVAYHGEMGRKVLSKDNAIHQDTCGNGDIAAQEVGSFFSLILISFLWCVVDVRWTDFNGGSGSRSNQRSVAILFKSTNGCAPFVVVLVHGSLVQCHYIILCCSCSIVVESFSALGRLHHAKSVHRALTSRLVRRIRRKTR